MKLDTTMIVVVVAAGAAAWWVMGRKSGLAPAAPSYPPAKATRNEIGWSDFDPFNPNAKYGQQVEEFGGAAADWIKSTWGG